MNDVEVITCTNKIGDDKWVANIKVIGDSKSINAVAKMVNSLVFLLRNDAPPVIEISVNEMPMKMADKVKE